MECKSPINMYKNLKTGKPQITYLPLETESSPMFQVRCGKCVNCRITRAQDISCRVMLEVMNCQRLDSDGIRPMFLTLTYDDEHLPDDELLRKSHLQDFIRALRKNRDLRYLACGEYGGKTGRPHYHLIVWFNTLSGFYDPIKLEKFNDDFYVSEQISEIWKYGNHLIGEVEPSTVNYVAGYVLKKMTGDRALSLWVTRSGEVVKRDTGFILYSLKPGIGANIQPWMIKPILRDGYMVLSGKKIPVPDYIKKLLKRHFPAEFEEFLLRAQSHIGGIVEETVTEFNSYRAREKTALACMALKGGKL